MGTPKTILFALLGGVTVWFLIGWVRWSRTQRANAPAIATSHSAYHAIVAFVCTFFDTLGIGNFAPTTSAFKFRGTVPDEKIPGTLNVGYALPTIAQAFIFISSVDVDASTLSAMIASAVVGAWLGAGLVAHWPRRWVQIGMGVALLAAAGLMVLRQFEIGPASGEATALAGLKLGVGLAAIFGLGALMTLGIGLYAPCLILVSLLGMNDKAAFPIMMGSCAFLMPVGGLRFLRAGSFDARAALVMTLCGLPAVFLAAPLVSQLSLTALRWLVVGVVSVAALMMLRSAWLERGSAAPNRGTGS
jgi:uncharacterized membrane protein YfcA